MLVYLSLLELCALPKEEESIKEIISNTFQQVWLLPTNNVNFNSTTGNSKNTCDRICLQMIDVILAYHHFSPNHGEVKIFKPLLFTFSCHVVNGLNVCSVTTVDGCVDPGNASWEKRRRRRRSASTIKSTSTSSIDTMRENCSRDCRSPSTNGRTSRDHDCDDSREK